ncbi:uncharacterized protein LOC115977387 isoform X1 [Quercus lobata]|uniref:uncharacterized protein LOC115977387 isoform X1 n=1 Tax=Quercus lobata TaxID=97700 RepID=UPI00124868E6|nr:uncharacterized protein LOC115977387 isoform X1 [Quercus lobata]XP_030955073.1 uncharacterized protein LOC115977387 isoform X1 [Quercus lobata]XP_030955074.1 uncharacterized protein LOC115977387 isoform X1 [Quercus lobata]
MAHLSAEADLKNVEAQAEDQRQLLHVIEIDLATWKQLVLDFKAELQEAKDAAQVVRKASEAAEKVAYECGVLETENRLAKEVAGVCRDYCTKTWVEALNWAGVLADFELRKAKSIFFPEDIQEALAELPPPTALPLPPPEQISSIQALSIDVEVSAGAGKGKKVLSSAKDTHSEDALTIKDVVS